MPFPGSRPVKTVCTQCHYSGIACMEGDVFFTPHCPRCGAEIGTKPLDNPLLRLLVKNIPPPLRRRLNQRYW